jgi:hypothetical protein
MARSLPITVLLIVGTLVMITYKCDAFLGSAIHRGKVHPLLNEFSEAYDKVQFQIGVDIPHDVNSRMESQSRLYIDNICLEFRNLPVLVSGADVVKLPGCNGPNPASSTGPLATHMHSHGKFISMNGMQEVLFDKGCWEMVWLENKPAGSIVCGFDIAQDVTRNGAKLPSGHVYLSFPVFTRETLDVAQAKKLKHETLFLKYSALQTEELEKMAMTKNVIKKAIHFRNAVGANEKASLMRTNAYKNVPTSEEDIVYIGDDLVLCKNGIVYHEDVSEIKTRYHRIGHASLKNVV